MVNPFAYLVLFSWPLVAVFLFRKLSLQEALVWTIMGGYLFLPRAPAFDFPLLPQIDKLLIPSMMALILCFPAAKRHAAQSRMRQQNSHQEVEKRATYVGIRSGPLNEQGTENKRVVWIIRMLLIAYLLSPFPTILTNNQPGTIAGIFVPGLKIYDAFSLGLQNAVAIIPFLLARRFLSDTEGHVVLLKTFCVAGLIYSFLALYEVKMSPELSMKIYGFGFFDFGQHFRGGTWRPIVFLHHGLWVGVFLAMSVLSAATLIRHFNGKLKSKYTLYLLWLFPVLIISKNLGATVAAFLLGIILLIISAKKTRIVTAIVAATILIYPMLRGGDLIPTDQIYSFAASYDKLRADSLKTRLDNEDRLLAKAQQKPLFGWGPWGRSRVYDEASGRDITISDGVWIIIIGVSGWFGYLATFGLMCMPIILLSIGRRPGSTAATIGLGLVLTVNLIDLIPNGTLTPLTWLTAGAIAGFLQRVPKPSDTTAEQDEPMPEVSHSPYSRGSRHNTRRGPVPEHK